MKTKKQFVVVVRGDAVLGPFTNKVQAIHAVRQHYVEGPSDWYDEDGDGFDALRHAEMNGDFYVAGLGYSLAEAILNTPRDVDSWQWVP